MTTINFIFINENFSASGNNFQKNYFAAIRSGSVRALHPRAGDPRCIV